MEICHAEGLESFQAYCACVQSQIKFVFSSSLCALANFIGKVVFISTFRLAKVKH